jgi:hypothetical protein
MPRVEDDPSGAAAEAGKVTVAAWVESKAEQSAPTTGIKQCNFMVLFGLIRITN